MAFVIPPAAELISNPLDCVPVISRFSKRRSWVGKPTSAPSNLETETVDVEPAAISISKSESTAVSARVMSMSLALLVVIVFPAL